MFLYVIFVGSQMSDHKYIERGKTTTNIQLRYFEKPISIDNLMDEIISHDLKFPEIVTAQSILECGWSFDSYNARIRNNLFGLKGSGEYLNFESWQQSVEYYATNIQNRYSGGDYYEFLNRIGYASDPEYTQKLKSICVKM